MRVLITGAGGYLGSVLLHRLSSRHELIGTWRQKRPAADSGTLIRCDLDDPAAVDALIAKARPDGVVHAAAAVGRGNGDYVGRAMRDNVAATANLVSAATAAGCRRFVYCSTISVYPVFPLGSPPIAESVGAEPRDLYGRSKWLGEEVLEAATVHSDMTGISLRFAGIHGAPRLSGALARMARSALRREPVTIDEPRSLFGFVFAEDAANAVSRALSSDVPQEHHRLNVGGAEGWSLSDWAGRLVDILGSDSQIIANPDGIERQETLDTTHIRNSIGFEPAPNEERLHALAAWLQTQCA